MPSVESRRPHTWMLLLCMGVLMLLSREWMHLPDGHTHLSFLDVGQGDSALITTPSGKHILIDGGPDLTTLEHLGTHFSFFDRTIDLLVLSHPNLDHYASFPEVFSRYSVKHVLFAGSAFPLAQYDHLLAAVKAEHTDVIIADIGQHLDFSDGTALDVIWPGKEFFNREIANANDASVTVRLTYKNHSALFTGDMETVTENAILNTKQMIRSEVLKVGHHGSKTSSSSGFLLAVHPAIAVISVGINNTYGHPNSGVIARLKHFGATVLRTDKQGTIELKWD